MGALSLLGGIKGMADTARGIIQAVGQSKKERDEALAAIAEAEASLVLGVVSYEKQLLTSQRDLILAEAQGPSVLQRNWRPVTMLVFLCLVVADSFGLLATPLAPQMWTLLQLGLGGYVAGRSIEKIAKEVMPAVRDMQLRRKVSKAD